MHVSREAHLDSWPVRCRAVAQGLAAVLRLDSKVLEVAHPRLQFGLMTGVCDGAVGAQAAVNAHDQITEAPAHLQNTQVRAFTPFFVVLA